MTNPTIEFTFTKKQGEAFRALQRPDIEELLYGGAKGGGKSMFGCMQCFIWAKQIIKDFKLEPRKYPIVVGFMGRKQSVDFTSTTLETWKRVIPSDAYTIKQQEKLIVIDGAVAIKYGGLDDSDTVKKFNSAEFAFFFIDQAEECTEQDIGLLRGTLRLKINGKHILGKGLLTANPAVCWLKPAFITAPQPKTMFIRALPSDNPFLPESYTETLRKAFAFRPELLKAYLYGSWDDLEGAFVVIPAKYVEMNVNNTQWDKTIIKRITFADIAGETEEGDETVIYDFENTKLVNSEIFVNRNLMDTAGRIIAHQKQNRSNLVGADEVGIGAGVVSRLRQVYEHDDIDVIGFCGGEREGLREPEAYANYKTEAWFYAAQQFIDKRCDIPNDPVLISQLSSVTYHYATGEKLILDSKKDLRKKLGHSPDRAEAYVMGLDALRNARPVIKVDKYATHRGEDYDYEFNAATC